MIAFGFVRRRSRLKRSAGGENVLEVEPRNENRRLFFLLVEAEKKDSFFSPTR